MSILVSVIPALVGGGVGFISGFLTNRAMMNHQRSLQRQTLGIDMMYKFWDDREFQGNVAKVMKIAKEEPIKKYAKKIEAVPNELDDTEKEKWKENRSLIIRTIDYFEVIATGINRNIYDEDIIKSLLGSQVIRLYKETSLFIEAFREEGDLYKNGAKEFQKLADKWSEKQE